MEKRLDRLMGSVLVMADGGETRRKGDVSWLKGFCWPVVVDGMVVERWSGEGFMVFGEVATLTVVVRSGSPVMKVCGSKWLGAFEDGWWVMLEKVSRGGR